MPGRKSQTERELRDLESASASGSDEELDQVGSLGAGPSAGRRKRKRLSDLSAEERFQNMPLKEKQKLSAQYRALQAEADDMKQNLANTNIADLEKKMRQGEELFQEGQLAGRHVFVKLTAVRDPTLGALDARFMMTGAETALLMARKMRMDNNAFNVDEYLIRVKGLLGLERDELEDQDESDEDEDELDEESAESRRNARRENARKGRLGDWAKIGWMAAKFVRRVPGVEFMYGPINTAPKPRINRTNQRRAQIEEESRPQEIRQEPGEPAGSDATTANVQLIGKLLRRRDSDGKGINFFRFVINPDDFGQSVENCFYVSFLIKDGKAGIEVTNEGEVLIFNRNPFNPDVDEGKEPDRNQAVMELTMAAWETAKELYDITEPTIPHRVYKEARPLQANRWYT